MCFPLLRVSLLVRCQLVAELAVLTVGAAALAVPLAPPGTALWLLAGGAAGGAAVWIWTGRTITCAPGALVLAGSFWLDTLRVLPRRSMLGLFSFAPPLLRLAGCRVVVLATFTGRVWLPGLSQKDLAVLLSWYQITD